MKKSLVMALALIATACGATNNSSTTLGNDRNQTASDLMLVPISGTIESVKVRPAQAPGLSLWTEVTIGYEVDCTEELANVAHTYNIGEDGKVTIFEAAFVTSRTRAIDEITCQSIAHTTKVVELDGSVDRSQIELISMATERVSVPADTARISSARSVKIIGTHDLCPADVQCVLNGTVVELEVLIDSCVNSVGPVSFAPIAASQDQPAIMTTLVVNAIEFHSKREEYVRCAQHAEIKRVTLPNFYVGTEGLKLLTAK